MLGRIDPAKKNVTVVGAGVSGLLTAYFLDSRGYHVTLLEKSSQVGGLIQRHELPTGLAESAAHSLLATPPVVELCEKLGIELISVQADSKARYIFRDARMQKLPLKWIEIVRALGRALFIRSSGEETTVQDWAEKHLGKTPTAYLMTPMLRGIYGASPSEISLTGAFPKLKIPQGKTLVGYFLKKILRARFGSAQRVPRPRMMTPKGGMYDFVTQLEKHLRARLQDRFKPGTEIKSVATLLQTDQTVVLCTPAEVSAKLLGENIPLASALHEVAYSPMVSVTAHAPTSAFASPPRGVGVLMPVEQNPMLQRDCLGILFNSSAFSDRVRSTEWHSFTVMLGGSQGQKYLDLSDDDLNDIVRKELAEVLGMKKDAELNLKIFRWPRAIPLYSPELEKTWKRIEAELPEGLVLCSNYTGQVSIRGILENLHSRLEPASRS